MRSGGADALTGLLGRPGRTLTRDTQPTGENEPTPNERLPPRKTGTELRRTTARNPELHGQRNALKVARRHPTLETLPTNADQEMPTPSGPTALKMLSHTFFFERASTEWLGRGQHWTRRRTRDARLPEGVVSTDFVFSGAEWQGAFQWLQQACQPVGRRGGWRDCCIVIAPERSGLGAFDVLLALVSRRASDDAKREDLRTGTSEAAGVTGVSLARRVLADVRLG